MKKPKKILITTLCILTFNSAIPCYAYQTTYDSRTEEISNSIDRSDVLVWKYKTIGGVTYKRRWNETKSCWYDPAWIPA